MPEHWTFADGVCRDSDLEQGDILYPSVGLVKLFKEVHPHFADSKYLGFLVATQTCDLVRRKGGVPKARYIELAVIRPLAQVLPKLIAHVARPVGGNRFRLSDREEAKRLLERIFNQNEQSLGLFFIYPAASLRIGESAVAMLRVTIAVKNEHYSLLSEARVGRLDTPFQAKLGWLLGNLYNRPATPDWSDVEGGKATIEKMISSHVGEPYLAGEPIEWIPDQLIDAARKEGRAVDLLTFEEFEALKSKPPLEKALEEIVLELSKINPDFPPEQLTKLRNRLTNNGKFKALLVRQN